MKQNTMINQTRKGALTLLLTALTLPLFCGGATKASAQTATTIHVEAINVGFYYVTGYRRRPNAYVYVKDNLGQPVAGATVTGTWSGCLPGTGSAVTQIYTTDANGNPVAPYSYAHIVHPKTHSCGGRGSQPCAFVFTVTSITHPSLQYDPSTNLETSGSTSCF